MKTHTNYNSNIKLVYVDQFIVKQLTDDEEKSPNSSTKSPFATVYIVKGKHFTFSIFNAVTYSSLFSFYNRKLHDVSKGMNWTKAKSLSKTRIHSSGMLVARLLTKSQHALRRGGCLPRGGCLLRGSLHGGCLPWGVSTQGGVYSSIQWGRFPPWTHGHLWKHNLHKLRLPTVITNLDTRK